MNKDDRKISQKDLEGIFTEELARLPDIRSWVINENGERGLSLIVCRFRWRGGRGDGAQDRQRHARAFPELSNVVSNSALDRPEVRFRPRPDIAAELGVSTEDHFGSVRIATIGDVDANLAKFNAGDRQIPIRVQLDDEGARQPAVSRSAEGPHRPGRRRAALSVADVRDAARARRDRPLRPQRRVIIGADLVGNDALGDAVARGLKLPEAKNLPAGVELQAVRRCRNDGRGLRELRQCHGRRHHDGLRRAGPAVRQLPAADHHPVLAAAVDRRRDRRAGRHRPGRSACRSSSAS